MTVRVAAIQLGAFRGDYSRQMDAIAAAVARAAADRADIVCLPELMTTPYFGRSRDLSWRDAAEPLPTGETYTRIAAMATEHQITIIATCYERVDDRRYNTAFIVRPDGILAGRYAKTHIPFIEAVEAFETCFFDPGDDLPVFDLPGLRAGLLICYDRSFPEAWRTLALKGAQAVFVPTSSSGFRGAMYRDELKIAAAQHQIYVVAANKAGDETLPGEPGHITFYGKSSIIGPDGEILAALEREEDTFITADLDPAVVTAARERLNYYRDRRPDLYLLGR